eukprot:TRINITY_DN2695_c0_g2_i1.p1 TRINITY_DN2695_c0_g2~~TRINITY_DN2695_c0_g2_i1.p1  ORF type:complete len:342 (+),score=45.53 TRINITY_DN2695_c0_g2_i1:201-1226(+)
MSSETHRPSHQTSLERYFCHQCEQTVMIAPSPDLICPRCNGGFVEELQNPNPDPNPNPNPNPFFSSSSDSVFPLLFSASSDLSGRRSPEDPDPFNPFLFLQNYLQELVAGGANVQFVLDDQTSEAGPFRIPANFGDYFVGPGLEQLIQQLAENDPNRYGTPPASKAAVEALPDVQVSGEELHSDSDSAQCAVCKDAFEPGVAAKQMPCRHMYHPDCILPWLAMHNSCPVCRYELPTDDPDYESRGQGTGAPVNSALAALLDSGVVAPEENSPGAGALTGERRMRISLPWPFRAFGSPAGTSNSGLGGNDNNNEEEMNENTRSSGDQGNRDVGAGSRQEGLD